MNVCVIGLGYIGLPTALMMASHGVQVDAVDYNPEVIHQLQNNQVTFEEKGLDELFQKAVAAGINFRSDYPSAPMYVVAVPTPYEEDTKKIDASYVVKAVEQVLEVCPKNAIVVVESTVSPGTIDRDVRPLVKDHEKQVQLVHAPERIIPGNMLYELIHNSRTIGSDDRAVGEKVRDVYATFCQGEIILTDIRTAEMTKVVENTFRDINIAFANELTRICRKGGMDVYEVIRIANHHPRVNILQPGPGVGGHCISVDPWFLVGDYPEEAQLIHQARKVNSGMPAFVLERIQQIMAEKGIQDTSRIGLYGLSYKEDVDDTRESPTLQLLDVMKEKGVAAPAVYDPMVARDLVDRQYHDYSRFLNDVDMVVVLVGHSQLRNDLASLEGKVVLDTRKVCEEGKAYHL